METLDDLIQQHNTTYRTVSIRVSEGLFEWLKEMAAKMKVSRAKLTELMFNHGYEHFLDQTKNGGNGTGTEDTEKVEGKLEELTAPPVQEEAVESPATQ